MSTRPFQLMPFTPLQPDSEISVSGKIVRQGGALNVFFILSDPLGDIEIPPLAAHPERRDNLWQKTCFEFFIRVSGTKPYWECNLSPTGHWNVYNFTEYRKGMKEEKSISTLPFTVHRIQKGVELAVQFPTEGIFAKETTIDLALSTVLNANKKKMYWALTHPGPEPNFHHEDAFLITLVSNQE